MGAVAAGLIMGTGLKLLPSLQKNVLGIPLSAGLGVLSFAAIALLKLPLAWVLLGLGAIGCVVAFRRIR
jgi:chromate transporter